MREPEVIFNEAKRFFQHLKDTSPDFRDQLRNPKIYKVGVQNPQIDIEKEMNHETINESTE